ITNLGAILFAKKMEDFPSLERKAIRVIVYGGTSRTNSIREQIGTKGYASGFEGMIEFIRQNLPTNEEIGRALRTTVGLYPTVALRELIANALIHQDFDERGTSPTAEIFSDRIEIRNPGLPIINISRFIDDCQSRNEKIARTMRKFGICEERG